MGAAEYQHGSAGRVAGENVDVGVAGVPARPGYQAESLRMSVTPGPRTMGSTIRCSRKVLPAIAAIASATADMTRALMWCFFILPSYFMSNTRRRRGMATIAAEACLRQSFSVQRFQTVRARIAAAMIR
jgi:hypothetical protein